MLTYVNRLVNKLTQYETVITRVNTTIKTYKYNDK